MLMEEECRARGGSFEAGGEANLITCSSGGGAVLEDEATSATSIQMLDKAIKKNRTFKNLQSLKKYRRRKSLKKFSFG